MFGNAHRVFLITLLACIVHPGSAQAPIFTFTLIPYGTPDVTSLLAAAINASGDVVGSLRNAAGSHGFLLKRCCSTGPIIIDHPDGANFTLTGINDHGQIVGYYRKEESRPAIEASHAFLLERGVFTTIAYPRSRQTRIYGINNAGVMVGRAVRPGGGFLYSQGEFTPIECPDGSRANPRGINNKQQVAGFCGRNSIFFWEGGQTWILEFDSPPSRTAIVASGINDNGDIAGHYFIDNRERRGFLLTGAPENPVFTTVHPGPSAVVGDINNNGQIVGFMASGSFVGTPR